jgi:drug/metabolite transporter (DMT)-like permease
MNRDSRPSWATVTPILWFGVFAFCWALIERLGIGITHHYEFEQIVTMRYAVHLLVLLAIARVLGLRPILATARPAAQIARGVCMFVMPAGFVLGVGSIGARDLWTLFWCMPVLVAALAHWWLGERLPRATWIYLALGYAGVMAILRPSADALSMSAIWPLLSALSFALYVVLSRVLRNEPIQVSLLYTGLAALLCMLPFAVAVWRPLHAEDLPRIVAVGLVGLVALFAIDRALERLSASVVAPLLFVCVVSETLLEALRSAAFPPRGALAGSVLLLGVAAAVLLGSRLMGQGREQR